MSRHPLEEEERSTDEELLARMRRKDPAAVQSFYDRYFQRFLRVALRLTGDLYTAQDLAHDALLKVLTRVDTYQPGRNPRAWAMSILTRTFLDWKRRLKVRKASSFAGSEDAGPGFVAEPPAAEPTPQDRLEAEEKIAAVQAALLMLDDEQRLLITLRVYEELSAPETSEVLGITVEKVGGRLFRAKQRLRVLLEANWPGLFP